ncbi:hypothetical protein [Pseudacidovorax intermedius]|uniref:hypothetical protein n=1 Tax=Pseudacidovorax intermedius TaxID=433924 RepID=UPI0026E95018|nr:hypothetical protein [Pseudacidovorax intermedius]
MNPIVVPLVTSAVAAAALRLFKWLPSFGSVAESMQFGGSIASIAVTMLGFMLAALAVLASINHTHLVSMMKRTGHYSDLLRSFFIGASMFLFCAVFGYALLFGAPTRTSFLAIGLGIHIGAFVVLLDCGRKFWLVLTNLRS